MDWKDVAGAVEQGAPFLASVLAMTGAGAPAAAAVAAATKAPLPDIIRMATLTPTERAGIDHDVGSLAIGKRADVLVLSKQLKVRHVVSEGVRQ